MLDLLIEEMQDLCDAEKQLLKALPEMAKATANEELIESFKAIWNRTKVQVVRLERAFETLDVKQGLRDNEGLDRRSAGANRIE